MIYLLLKGYYLKVDVHKDLVMRHFFQQRQPKPPYGTTYSGSIEPICGMSMFNMDYLTRGICYLVMVISLFRDEVMIAFDKDEIIINEISHKNRMSFPDVYKPVFQ